MSKQVIKPNAKTRAMIDGFRLSLPTYRRSEVYRMLTASWDIVHAQMLIAQEPVELTTIPVAATVQALGLDDEVQRAIAKRNGIDGQVRIRLPLVYVSHEYAIKMDPAELQRPLIAATMIDHGETAHMLIDGNHRLFRAAMDGLESLPCYVLDVEQTARCRRS